MDSRLFIFNVMYHNYFEITFRLLLAVICFHLLHNSEAGVVNELR